MSELVHALVLLTTFHALASLVFGCGVVCDDETDEEAAVIEPAVAPSLPPTADAQGQAATSQLLEKLQQGDDEPAENEDAPAVDRREAFLAAGLEGEVGNTPELPQIDLFDRYSGGVLMVYADFDMRVC